MASFSVRLYGLRERDASGDLWWDELGLLQHALGGAKLAHEGPLNIWLTRAWIYATRTTDAWTLHLLPVFFGSVMPLALALATKEVAGARAGWVAFVLGIMSPVSIYFSRELRPYALLALMTALVLACAIRSIEAPSRRATLVEAVVVSIACLTHPAAVPVIGMGLVAQAHYFIPRWFRHHTIDVRAHLLRAFTVAGAATIGTLWSQSSMSTVLEGPYAHGASKFFWAAVPTLGPTFLPGRDDSLADNVTIFFLVFVALGVFSLVRARLYLVTLLLGSIVGGLATLYMNLGPKGDWPWLRYAAHLAVPMLVLAAVGAHALAARFTTFAPLIGLGLLGAFFPSFSFWMSNAEKGFPMRYLPFVPSALEESAKASEGVIFSPWRSAYGPEGERAVMMYERRRKTERPIYLSDGSRIFSTDIRRSDLGVGGVRVPAAPVSPPPGKYVFVRGSDHIECRGLGMIPTPYGGAFVQCVTPARRLNGRE